MHVTDTDATEKGEALRFLKEQHLACLATVAPNGQPSASFVYFVADDDYVVYFMTRRDSRKWANATANGRCAVAVADEERMRSVQMEGDVVELTDPAEVEQNVHRIFRSSQMAEAYLGNAPMKFLPPADPTGKAEHYAILCFRPKWLRWMRKNAAGQPEYFELMPNGGS